MAMAAILIRTVVIQPINFVIGLFLYSPIIFLLLLILTMNISITGATIPFAIAEYKRAFIGSIPIKLIKIPIIIETIITP